MSDTTSRSDLGEYLAADRPSAQAPVDGQGGGRKRRSPRSPSAQVDGSRASRAGPEAAAPPPPSPPAVLWRSLELLEGQLLIRTNVGIQPARLSEIAAVIELLPECLLRQEHELRGHSRASEAFER